MRIIIETINPSEIVQLLTLFQSLNISNIEVKDSATNVLEKGIIKGDKSLNPRELFGIWEENPRNLAQIRSNAWKRNWNI